MNDLLDLDLSTPPTQLITSLTGSRLNPQAACGTGKTAFDYLSQAGRPLPSSSSTQSSSPTPSPLYKSQSPSPLAFVQQQQPSLPRSHSPAQAQSPQQGANRTTSADDAFSSLFGSGSASSAMGTASSGSTSRTATTSMFLAEKLATSNAARFGDGGRTNPLNGNPSSSTAGKAASSDPWDFDLLAKATPAAALSKPSSSSSALPPLDPFDLAFETTATAHSTRSPAPRTTAVTKTFDDDHDDDPFGTGISLPGQNRSNTTSTPPTASDDFDLLGAFSQPAAVPKPSPAATQQAPTPQSPASQGPHRRSVSPPPHVLGQIVQMGFSVPQAQAALGATVGPNGEWRVEQALEVLIEQSSGGAQNGDSNRANGPAPISRRRPVALDDEEGPIREAPVGDSGWGSDDEEDARRRERRRREAEMDDDAPPRSTPLPTGRRAREAAARQRDQQAADDSANDAVAAAQRQANELLAQASKIGFSMFKSANAYISAGKAQFQKALDEQRIGGSGGEVGPGEGDASGGAGRRTRQAASTAPPGRPKWWTEEMENELAEEERPSSATMTETSRSMEEPPPTLFHDSEDDEVLPQRSQHPPSQAPVVRTKALSPALSSTAPPVAQAMAAAAAYVSPWRRAKQQAPSAVDAVSMPQAPSLRAGTPTQQRAPALAIARPSYAPRTHVPVSPGDLATLNSFKTKGNDLFKLGRFGDASAEYTQAIDALPSGTLHLVPLLNNRATARLKVGEERLASEDCTLAINILLAPYGGLPKQAGERLAWAALEAEELPSDVNELKLVDQLGKALGKRAKANEANEKWSAAADDWALAFAAGGDVVKAAGGFKIVSDGVARCRKMVSGPTNTASLASSTAPSTTRSAPTLNKASNAPASRPFKPVVQVSGEAVKALKAANQASEAEDDLRLQLKDGVDAKIAAWKGGKEQNLRALIASLDSVLWPELGWKKVGMHELISEGQLKVRYVRAIAKLHPDKLNVQNTTVEQRMIAGLVFAALNDAWNAQKS